MGQYRQLIHSKATDRKMELFCVTFSTKFPKFFTRTEEN